MKVKEIPHFKVAVGVIWKDNSTYSSIEQNGTDFIISSDQGASHASSALVFKVDAAP